MHASILAASATPSWSSALMASSGTPYARLGDLLGIADVDAIVGRSLQQLADGQRVAGPADAGAWDTLELALAEHSWTASICTFRGPRAGIFAATRSPFRR